jgi:hypothetical protein
MTGTRFDILPFDLFLRWPPRGRKKTGYQFTFRPAVPPQRRMRYWGRDFRVTDDYGKVVQAILA